MALPHGAGPDLTAALPVGYADVRAAAERLRGVAHRTPVVTSRTLDEDCGAAIFLKCENLQRMGAFKFRGAYNLLSTLSPERRKAGVVAYSSGNHAQGVALAARLLGTLSMPLPLTSHHSAAPANSSPTATAAQRSAAVR